ncbi:type II toxin-antitoxin system PemK/MazF family toxin [Patescibacteria group bacterium]|nr:type II toxin-antitoxin system PemK/MazF family toxin [Patescibacteria group bacterium]
MKKDFDKWNERKKALDGAVHQPPLISEGDLWWCSASENIGTETSGKGVNFTRPVVVLKKFGRISFLGIPTTTHAREGSWYAAFKHQGIDEVAMLNQARVFSYKRLDRKMGTLDGEDFKNVKEAYARLFTDDPPLREVAGKSRM